MNKDFGVVKKEILVDIKTNKYLKKNSAYMSWDCSLLIENNDIVFNFDDKEQEKKFLTSLNIYNIIKKVKNKKDLKSYYKLNVSNLFFAYLNALNKKDYNQLRNGFLNFFLDNYSKDKNFICCLNESNIDNLLNENKKNKETKQNLKNFLEENKNKVFFSYNNNTQHITFEKISKSLNKFLDKIKIYDFRKEVLEYDFKPELLNNLKEFISNVDNNFKGNIIIFLKNNYNGFDENMMDLNFNEPIYIYKNINFLLEHIESEYINFKKDGENIFVEDAFDEDLKNFFNVSIEKFLLEKSIISKDIIVNNIGFKI